MRRTVAVMIIPLASLCLWYSSHFITPSNAVGETLQDDTAALQLLCDRGGSIKLEPRTFRITKPLTIDLEKSGFTAIDGGNVTRVMMTGPGPAIRIIGHHTGTAAPQSVKPVVWDRERMPVVQGLEIVGEHEEADGIIASGTMMLTIQRVAIRECRHGIRLTERNRNVIISDCHIYKNRGIGVFLDAVNLHQINITGSHVSYNSDGGIVVRGGEVRNLQISGCDIEANHGVDRPATANVLVDSTNGSHAEVAITGNTIQHTHEANGSANIRIKGPSLKRAHTEELRDGHITITGNILSDVHVNIHFDHVRAAVVTGNTLWTAYSHNILIEQSSNIVLGPNILDRNPRYAREESPTTANNVVIRNSSDCSINGLQLSGARAGEAGIVLDHCDRFLLTNCMLLDCEPIGLLLKDLTRSRVSNCWIRDDKPVSKSKPLVVIGGTNNMIDSVNESDMKRVK